MTRTFTDRPAVRSSVPLLVGLFGPSGGGKTLSALRLATGIVSVTGGEVFYIDTEARRAAHYADHFTFRHVEFGEPFGALDYLAAIRHCADRGAGVIVVDSMSHEHEGPGGLLEAHASETARLAKAWRVSEDVAQMSAWQKPKADRRRLLNSILQMPVSFVFCFRAKEKLKIVSGKAPKSLGWMPIAGEEFVYEMTVSALLLPQSGGVPTWNPAGEGERQMVKLPGFAQSMFGDGPLDEATGAKLARWAAGPPKLAPSVVELVEAFAAAAAEDLESLEARRREAWAAASPAERAEMKRASVEAHASTGAGS